MEFILEHRTSAGKLKCKFKIVDSIATIEWEKSEPFRTERFPIDFFPLPVKTKYIVARQIIEINGVQTNCKVDICGENILIFNFIGNYTLSADKEGYYGPFVIEKNSISVKISNFKEDHLTITNLREYREYLLKSKNTSESIKDLGTSNEILCDLLKKSPKKRSFICSANEENWILKTRPFLGRVQDLTKNDRSSIDDLVTDICNDNMALCQTLWYMSDFPSFGYENRTESVKFVREFAKMNNLGDPVADADRMGISKENAKLIIFGSEIFYVYDPDITGDTTENLMPYIRAIIAFDLEKNIVNVRKLLKDARRPKFICPDLNKFKLSFEL